MHILLVIIENDPKALSDKFHILSASSTLLCLIAEVLPNKVISRLSLS